MKRKIRRWKCHACGFHLNDRRAKECMMCPKKRRKNAPVKEYIQLS